MRADVGSELSTAGGRSSEVSEWPRSKFPASAVRQHRNFGHRNRIIGPYGEVIDGAGCGRTEASAPTNSLQYKFLQQKRDAGEGIPLNFYAGAIALARVCAYSISRRFDCLASWVTLGRISSRTPLSYLALMLAVSMPATLKLRL